MTAYRLARSKVTAGSQVILPAYPALTIAVGMLFLLQRPERTSGAAFQTAKELFSIHEWGLLFLSLGILKVLAFVIQSVSLLRTALIMGCGLCGFWAVLLFLSALDDIHASYTSCLWVLFAMLAHIASARSLTKDTVFHAGRV